MPTTEKSRLLLAEAVAALGGPLRASKQTGIARTTIIHWIEDGHPYYRQHEVDKLIELGRKTELETLERLQRKYKSR